MCGMFHNVLFRDCNNRNHHFMLGPILIILHILLLLVKTATAQLTEYSARITQIDRERFPTIRVYVSITDATGAPIPDNLPIQLTLFEEGEPVSQNILSQGWTLSSVLVLDVSGSMQSDNKIQKAKEAAINYLNMAPQNYRVAVVSFSDTPMILGGFGVDRGILRNRIWSLKADGKTALQDGIALALDLLRSRRDRKAVIALTDGQENNSRLFVGEAGYSGLLQRTALENCSISTIGLGSDVDVKYLRGYQKSGGWYFFSPSADALRSIFEKAVILLEKEKMIEYVTTRSSADGSTKNLKIDLKVGNKKSTDQRQYTSPGVIPHVYGNHIPYLIVIFGLLLAPNTFSMLGYFISVYRFRSVHFKRLLKGSPYIGKRDPNIGPGGREFVEGDPVIICPICPKSKTPHHVRSWRMLKCRCMRDPRHQGSYCYPYRFPRWLRLTLDFLSGERMGEMGRTWLWLVRW